MTPAYFNPAAQPDTETQYRLGGRVNKMQKFRVAKKMPRKFQAGGKATAPALTGMDLERENARRDARVKKEKDAYEAQRPNSLGPRPAEKPEVKKAKGGSIRKFYEGGDVREGANSSISDDTRARAQRFLETGNKDDDVATKATYKASPKKVSTVKVGAKPAPAKSSGTDEVKPAPAKSSGMDEVKPAPAKSSGMDEVKPTKIVSADGKEPYDLNTPAYPRDAPTLGNRDKSGREQKFDFNAENAALAATAIPVLGAAARLGQGAYRTGKMAYESAKGLAEGVKSGVSAAKGLYATQKSRDSAVGAREASNRLANARAADKTKKVVEETEGARASARQSSSGMDAADMAAKKSAERATAKSVRDEELEVLSASARQSEKGMGAVSTATKQAAKDKKDAGPIFKAAKTRADSNRIDKAAAAKQTAKNKEAAATRRSSRTSDESKMADEGGPNFKKGGTVKKFASGGMARGYGISKVTNKTKYC